VHALPCTRWRVGVAALAAALLLLGCGSRVTVPAAPDAATPSAADQKQAAQQASRPDMAKSSEDRGSLAPGKATGAPRHVQLPAPRTPRNNLELRYQFARRLIDAHPDSSYVSRAPDRLHAIPVLEVELNADGSVRRIEVLRRPSTGDEATQLAIAAVRRAAPYGDVSRLPRPWKVVETFLFNDQMHFKPRLLDLD